MFHSGGWWSYLKYDEEQDKPSFDRALIKRVLTYASPYRIELALVLVTIILVTVTTLLPPLLIRDLLDNAIPDKNLGRVTVLGLLMVAALRALAPDPRITVLARHPFQARHAETLGAGKSVLARGDYLAELAEAAGTRLLQPIIGRPIGVGGFDVVYVCISSTRGVEDAMRFARAGATIVLLGNASTLRGLDWTPLWLKELTFRGTLAYGGHAHGGANTNAFTEAATMVADGRAPVAGLVTHEFPLGRYQEALQAARAKGSGESVKVVFRF